MIFEPILIKKSFDEVEVQVERQKLKKWRAIPSISLSNLIICIVIILIVGCGCAYCRIIQESNALFEPVLLDHPPEVIFQSRFMDGLPIPAEVSEIYGVEGSGRLGEGPGPAYIRFQATSSFIQEMVTKDYGSNGSYTMAACPNVPFTDFYIERFPEKFQWWQPSQVVRPVCYRAHTCTLYDEKFLLIDPNNSIVYYYRTPVCGLCPSGEAGKKLRQSEQCQK